MRQTVGAMIRYRFGRDDLLRTRFAVSPLFEVVWSAHVLRRPAQAPLHGPWVADARECLAGLDWSMLDWLANGYGRFGFVPDFITPPPATPLADVDGELERVRATPPEQVAREVGWRFEGREVPRGRAPAARRPGGRSRPPRGDHARRTGSASSSRGGRRSARCSRPTSSTGRVG